MAVDGMVNVRNRNEFKGWLKAQPRSVAVTVAVRAALRALPWINDFNPNSNWRPRRISSDFLARFLRGISATRLLNNTPKRVANAAADDASAVDDNSADAYAAYAATASTATFASAYAAAAAAAAFTDAAGAAAAGAISAAIDAAMASDAPAPLSAARAVAAAVQADVDDIQAMRLAVDMPRNEATQSLLPILNRPLWHGSRQPTELTKNWRKLTADWGQRPALGNSPTSNWWVWTEWYQAILDGTLDDARAKLYGTVPDKIWKQGIEAVNAHIAAKLRAMEIKTLRQKKQSQLGDQWVAEADHFKLDTAGGKTDARAAKNADVQRRHEELKEKVADLKGDSARLADVDWGGLAKAVDKLDHILSGPTSDVPSRIRAIYDYSLSVAHFLEEDNDLRKDVSPTNKRPLPPELRRKLVEIVRQLALWVRSFPTARKQDEELGSYIGQVVAATANAQLLINSASAAALISEEDRQLIIALIDAVRNNGPVSTKAAKKGVATTTNLLFKTGTLLSLFAGGMFTNALANESVLARRAAEWVGSYEKLIVEYIGQQAPDISVAIRSLLDDLRTRAGDPSAPSQGSDALFPSPPPPIRRRDR